MSKYRAVKVWACHECCRVVDRPTSQRKSARKCSRCLTHDSIKCFASKKEFSRWNHLRLLERAHAIRNLEYQPVFHFVIDGKRTGHKYTADAAYFYGNDRIVEDTKGVDTREGKLRREIAECIYNMKVTVVR